MNKKATLLLLLISFSGYTQDKTYARMILDTLCSPHFDGRGYYNNGEKRVAEFIKNEYQKIGLKSIEGKYFQNFNLSTNTIKGDLRLKFNKRKLKPGIDYLIDPASPSYNDKTEVVYLKKSTLINLNEFKLALQSFEGKFVVIDKTLIEKESNETKTLVSEIIQFLKYSPDVKLKGVIEVIQEKLTFGASQFKAERPHIIVLKDKLPKNLKNLNLKVENEFNAAYQSQNVIGFIEGEIKDRFIYVVGHYDHLGRMGKEIYFPGANDNASGIAMLLNLAKEFSLEKKPKYSMVFICFGSEEIGLVGSKYYTENPLLPLESIDFLINLDILGTGDDGIQVVNGKKHSKKFDDLVALNESKKLLKQVKIRGEACNSDHCFFSEKGVPSFFIYTLGGVAHYHNIHDESSTLPLTEYNDLFVLLKDFIRSFKADSEINISYKENLERAAEYYLKKEEIPLKVLLNLVPESQDDFSLYYETTGPNHKLSETDFFYDTTAAIYEQVITKNNNDFYLPSIQLSSFADGEFAEGFRTNLELIINLDINKFCKSICNKEYAIQNPIKYFSKLYNCK